MFSRHRGLADGPHVFPLRRAPELSPTAGFPGGAIPFLFFKGQERPVSLRSCTGQRPDSSRLLSHRAAPSPGDANAELSGALRQAMDEEIAACLTHGLQPDA
jgi:hypothetical protein